MSHTTQEIINAYRDTGSVWRAGKQLGMCGQSVHERLKAIGYEMQNRAWTKEENEELRTLISNGLSLSECARRLGRPYGTAATKASSWGLRVNRDRRKIPRGMGYDKESTRKHFVQLQKWSGSIKAYCRANGLAIEPLSKASEHYFPEQWKLFKDSRSDIPQKTCVYCETVFVPSTQKQVFCSRKCNFDWRTDKDYFGGKRRDAIGWDTQTCQLCGNKPKAHLSPHHMFGKANDKENDYLIALCRGCHNLVEMLANRTGCIDPAFLEGLISLAWLKKKGAYPAGINTVHVFVEIDTYFEALDDPNEDGVPE